MSKHTRTLHYPCSALQSYNAEKCALGKTTGWMQDELHMLLPWLVEALADTGDGHPGSVERLKAAALQLLPPLLDGLHARRLSGELDWVQFSNTLVGILEPQAGSKIVP